jgi:DNA (cytosine-5)-methyltransferase 1
MLNAPSPLHIVELYAGTARSAEAFRRWRRCRVSLLVDHDEYAARTYRMNYPRAPYIVQDLAKMSAGQLLASAGGQVDVLLGCPPCQGFSENGQRNPHDPRNRHLSHFARLAEELRPLAVAMENVPLAGDTPQFRGLVRRLGRGGYASTAGIINAALRGSTQSRQRLVFLAIRGDVRVAPVFPPATHGGTGEYFSYRFGCMRTLDSDRAGMLGIPASIFHVRELLGHWENDLGPERIPDVETTLGGLPAIGTTEAARLAHQPWAHCREQLRRMARVPEGGRWDGGKDHYSQSYGRLHRRGLARTITTAFPNAGSGRFWHPTENRSLTLREAARIQGFPDSFTFIPPFSLGAFLVGNALDRAIADLTYQVIRNCLS